ncbi:MAG: glycosyltransferase family 4 protein, partial [Oscillospiraceae bacterium]
FTLGQEITKLGHQVTVLAASYSHIRTKNPVIVKNFTEQYFGKLRYVFVKTPKYISPKNHFTTAVNVLSFLASLKIKAKALHNKYLPDVIVAASGYYLDVYAARAIAQYNPDIKVCYEMYNLMPMILKEKGTYSKTVINIAEKFEEYAIENSDRIISFIPRGKDYLESLGFHETNCVYFPNGAIETPARLSDPLASVIDEVRRLKRLDKFVYMYVGGMDRHNALDDVLYASKYLHPNIQILLIGNGNYRAKLEKAIATNEINNITILPPISKAQVIKTLRLADALYIGSKKSKIYEYGLPATKMLDYLMARKPIISAMYDSENIVNRACCGICVPCEDYRALAVALNNMSEYDVNVLKKMGENGYAYVKKNHDYEKLTKRYISIIRN